MPSINVKWGKEKLTVDADVNESPMVFKSQLFALSGVPPDRQKVMIKGRVLGDDSWNGITLSEGLTIMMMGSATAIPEPPKPTTDVEQVNENGEKAVKMPVGLKNLGNTCYMNSVLQSFRPVKPLQDAVAKLSNDGAYGSGLAENVKQVYVSLNDPRNTNGETPVTPFMLLHNLHQTLPQFSTKDGHGHLQQQDANECFTELQRILMEADARQRKEGETNVKNYFKGTYEVEYKCTESEDEPVQKTTEDFFQISCFLSNEVKYIQTGIKEKMCEEIEKNCASLQRDAKWQKKALIKRLPAYVSVQMVRFFYKEQTKTNAKILKDVKFPMILDLIDICTPELRDKLLPARDMVKLQEDAKIERMRKAKIDGKDPKKIPDDGEPLPYSFPDDEGSNNSGFYELQAVITHKGRSSDSGHYVAWIRIEGDNWAMCDDEHVLPVTEEQVLKLSGGGDWHTAYVLVYGPRIVKKYPELTAAAPAKVEDTVPAAAGDSAEAMQTE